MFIYFFKVTLIFPILFFSIARPMNEFLLENHIVPFLNNLFLGYPIISFDFTIDNLIFQLNESSHYYSLPFNEYYIIFFIIFSSKIFSRYYLHFHILNFNVILLAPFFYFFISFKLEIGFKLFSIIQSTVNFYFLIYVIFNFLSDFGPKSFRLKMIK